jgi:hypothetical protein
MKPITRFATHATMLTGFFFIAAAVGPCDEQVPIDGDPIASLSELRFVAGTLGVIGSSDGVGAAAQFSNPNGVAVDNLGNAYIADSNNAAIRKIVLATGEVSTLVGGTRTNIAVDGVGAAARLTGPRSLAINAAGTTLYTADGGAIRKIEIATATVTTIAGRLWDGNGPMCEHGDGIGSAARFCQAMAVALDNTGKLFITELSGVRQLDLATLAVTTLAGGGEGGGADGVGAAAHFDIPMGVVADNSGLLYVSDGGTATIRKIVIATGEVTTIAGMINVRGSQDGVGSAAWFNGLEGLALDGAGNLLIADTGNHTVRRMVLATGKVSTLVGVADSPGTVPGPLPASVSSPTGIAMLASGGFVLSDALQNAVLLVTK